MNDFAEIVALVEGRTEQLFTQEITPNERLREQQIAEFAKSGMFAEKDRCIGNQVEVDITCRLFRTAQILYNFDKCLYSQGLTASIEHRTAS